MRCGSSRFLEKYLQQGFDPLYESLARSNLLHYASESDSAAYAGVINTARYVSKLAGGEKIYAIMGGTHLMSASPKRIQETIEALRQLGVQKILLSHCTGVNAYAELAKALPGRCAWPPTGARIHFGGK